MSKHLMAPIGYRKDGRPIMPIMGGSVPPAEPPAPNPERPDGVTETEWNALGDPGKAALVRERARAAAAEQQLAALRNTSTPKPAPPKQSDPPKDPERKPDGDSPDIASLIQQAVAAAIAPLQQANAQREAEQAAEAIRAAVTTAAGDRFHDVSDALSGIDLTKVTDGNGKPDQQKITEELDGLLQRKPHLGKPGDGRRHLPPDSPLGSGGSATAPLDDRVKATLARMQAASGVKFAEA